MKGMLLVLVALWIALSGCNGEREIPEISTTGADNPVAINSTPAISSTSPPIPSPTGPPLRILDHVDVPMGLVPAGPFQMGSSTWFDNESPVHIVELESYYIDAYPVTNTRYRDCVDAGECNPPACEYYDDPAYGDHPVVCVNWAEAQVYCQWRGARLPTEAEWEKAARGRLWAALYPWGNEAPVCQPKSKTGAQFVACGGQTVSAGTFSPNGYGLYDMSGNVWEWVSSLFEPYPYLAGDGREDLSATGARVVRGGAWDLSEEYLRCAYRNWNHPQDRLNHVGFRCALSP